MDTLTFEEVTYDDVIARACFQLGIAETTDNNKWFETLIDEGARHLGCLSLFVKKNCELEIHNEKACLPKGFNRFLGLRFCANTFQPPPPLVPGANPIPPTQLTPPIYYNEAVYADLKFFNDCGCGCDGNGQYKNMYPYQSVFEIQGNMIHFHNRPLSDRAVIAYKGMNKDCEGRMILYENYERALWNYVCANYADQNPQSISETKATRYWKVWKAQKALLKGEEIVQHFNDTKRQVREWANALVVDKNWIL